MLLQIGWIFLGTEFIIALMSGLILWYFWSHSAMERKTARRALFVYALGSVLCLLLALLLPL